LLAFFEVSTSQPNVGEAVAFNGSRSEVGTGRSIVSYKWTFGDGGTATGKVVSHSYKSAGGFVATLTVTDDLGRTASISMPLSVSTTAPIAVFNISPNDVFIGDNVQFNAKASVAAAGRTLVEWQWDFGDGSSGSGQVVSHAYSAQKTYVVTLTVVDDLGQTASTSQDVEVETAAPKADFNISPPTADVGQVVAFNSALSTAPPGRTLTGYQWDFGDGTSSTAANPTHAYTDDGTYTVVLVVTDNTGAIGVTSKSITVTP
jgi:PKD repeat protein